MQPLALYFEKPFQVNSCPETLPPLGPDQLLVETAVSAISAGTELLVYRGQLPKELSLDASLTTLQADATYPLKYGYAAVGRVVEVGKAVDKLWINRLVFAFHPHASHFVVDKGAVQPVPEGMAVEDAVFLPNMETAVSFVMDAQPAIGEAAAVLGQGVVGLLTTAVLAQMPLAHLVTVDRYAARRARSQALGATRTLDPEAEGTRPYLAANEADVTFELSGNPAALDLAFAATGYSGRILIGSWYGQKRAPLDLGGKFHRSHIQLISSQVSQLHPRWRGRWDKARRFQTAWRMIEKIRPSQLITHRFKLEQAAEAYRLLDQKPEETLQIIFDYTQGEKYVHRRR